MIPDFSAPPPARRLVREPDECRAPAEIGADLAAAIPPSDRYGRITFADRNAVASFAAACIEFGTSAALRLQEHSR